MLLPCSRVFFVANTQFLLKAARAAGSHHLVWRRRPTISKARFAVTVFHKRLRIIEKYGIVGNLEPKANIYTHTQPVWSSANAIFWIPKLWGCASCIDSFNRGKRVMRCCRASLQCNSQWKFAYNAQGNLTLTWTRAWRLPCFLLLNWRQNETNVLFLTVTHKDWRGGKPEDTQPASPSTARSFCSLKPEAKIADRLLPGPVFSADSELAFYLLFPILTPDPLIIFLVLSKNKSNISVCVPK